MIHKILVATDGSEIASRAVDCAAELAARLGVALRIVSVMIDVPPSVELRDYAEAEHLIDPPEPTEPGEAPLAGYWAGLQPGAASGGGTAGLSVSLTEKIVKVALGAARDAGVREVEGQVLAGDPAGAILADAASQRADMIVVGSRGLGGIRSALLGSVSQKVLHDATCPVLVAH